MQEYAGVRAAAAFAIDAGRHERRRHQRVKVRPTGQFMRQDRREFPCATIDMSPGGIAFEAEARGEIGERIIAYLNQIGRVEGTVARHFYGGFAIQMKLPPRERNTTLTLPGGREHLARIIDVSRSGVALAVDVTPPIGTPVTVGSRPAQVARQFSGGLAVEFDRLIPAEMFDDDSGFDRRGVRKSESGFLALQLRIASISESIGHHDSEVMDDGGHRSRRRWNFGRRRYET
jgi:hypothetical protein